MIRDKNILITGGRGFIGSRLAKELESQNRVTIFDNFLRNAAIGDYFAGSAVRTVKGDVLDLESLMALEPDYNVIIHAAAIAGINSTVEDPVNTMNVNMIGTSNVLKFAKQNAKLDRFLDFSTSEVFGSQAYLAEESGNTVTGAVGEARWTYAVSKLASEHLVHAYFRQYGLPTVTVRPFNIYGPGQVGEGAISIMIRRALKGEDIYIFGSGSQIRAWCYIDDMVEALLKCLSSDKAVGESINLGNNKAVTTIYGLAQTICRTLGSKSKIIFKPALSADIELRVPSVDKAKAIIDFEAKIDLEVGILKTAEWIAENELQLPLLPEIFVR